MKPRRKQVSKRRWKARISMGQPIPRIIFAIWPDLARRVICIRNNHYTHEAVVALRV